MKCLSTEVVIEVFQHTEPQASTIAREGYSSVLTHRIKVIVCPPQTIHRMQVEQTSLFSFDATRSV